MDVRAVAALKVVERRGFREPFRSILRGGQQDAANVRARAFWMSWQRSVCTLSVVSCRCAAARRAAAAGLFNSCARPAAMVPSEASFSRCCE